jgi:acyl carrier protein
MTAAEVRNLIAELIGNIAPEADLAALADGDDMREALDLDSIDFTNLVIALHERTGLEIPEADYHQLYTLGGAVNYVLRGGASG